MKIVVTGSLGNIGKPPEQELVKKGRAATVVGSRVERTITIKIIIQKSKSMKILVTGATGKLGGAVVEQLMKKTPAGQIATLSRKAEKVAEMQSKGLKAYQGAYDDKESLEKAMQGIDKVLLISGNDQGDRMQQHKNVIDAAKKSGVQHIAYTSRSLRNRNTLANKLMAEHFLTEDYIRESGLPYTIYRNALYMEVLPFYVGKKVFESGFSLPAGDGKAAFALSKDMGEAIANNLLENESANKIYKFTGAEAYSFYDVAAVLTELSGKEVKYTPVDMQTFETNMKEAGTPDFVAGIIANFNTDIKNDQESEVTKDLEMALGRKPVSLKAGAKILFGF